MSDQTAVSAWHVDYEVAEIYGLPSSLSKKFARRKEDMDAA
jgi:hypothetical protein